MCIRDRPKFARHIGPEGSRTGLEFRPEQSGERAQARLHKLGGYPIGKHAGEVALEVVGHFALELNVGMHVESGPPPYANEIDVWGRRTKVQIVREDSYFDVVRILRHYRRRQ